MSEKDKRQHSRIDSVNLLNYVYLDENGKEIAQGMGRTLNVSKAGILLETHTPFEMNHLLTLEIGLEEPIVHITGKFIYIRKNEAGKFESGIQFVKIEGSSAPVLDDYITAFRGKKG